MQNEPSHKKELKLAEAETLAQEVIRFLLPYSSRIEMVGSIRRRNPIVHDIDIVMVPNDNFEIGLLQYLPESKVVKDGNKLIALLYKDTQVDLYLASPTNYEVIRLVRTGSAMHNIKLCTEAKRKGWKMKANGEGLLDADGKTMNITEEGILEKIFGKYIEPSKRD